MLVMRRHIHMSVLARWIGESSVARNKAIAQLHFYKLNAREIYIFSDHHLKFPTETHFPNHQLTFFTVIVFLSPKSIIVTTKVFKKKLVLRNVKNPR
jgi:hypothetical protein